MKKILLLNAPPSAGKDHAAKYLVKEKGALLDKFARVLKERTHAVYGFPERAWDYYEDCKEVPTDDFLGKTPRQAYIAISETYFKPHHGDDVFGQILYQELEKQEWSLAAISDSGFKGEAEVLVEKYGADNICLVRIRRDGCNFNSDSRDYIYFDDNIRQIDLYNDGTVNYTNQIDQIVEEFINAH